MTTQEQTFIDHIYAFARRLLLLRLLNRLIWLVLLILVLWLSVAVADRFFYFSTITRAGLWVIHVGILLYLLGRFLFSPLKDYWRLKPKSDLTQYVRILSKAYNDPHEDLVTAYQLITGRAQQGASGALQRAAIEKILKQYDSLVFGEQAKIRPFLPPLSLTAAVVIGFGLFISLHFTEFKRSTLRLLNPTKAYLPQPEYLLTVSPGDTTVVKGKDLRIIARYQGPSLTACRLVYWQPDRPQNPRVVFMKEKSQVFFYDLKNIRSDLMYAVEAEPRNRHLKDRIFRSPEFKVKMLIPPEVQEVQITVRPPAYTRMPKMVLEKNVGDFSAVAGSRVTVRIRSNKEVLSSAWVGFGSGTKVPFRLRGGSGTAEFFVRSADEYRIFLRDTSALGNPDPITYHIAVLPDDAPRVEIVQPGQDMESVPDAIIPV
ncbi:MAG TPA: hypothetical protein ENJ89_11355, partial [Caldithrix abyssi]|nr:hypothetical protein [Caldithrix abyssi]